MSRIAPDDGHERYRARTRLLFHQFKVLGGQDETAAAFELEHLLRQADKWYDLERFDLANDFVLKAERVVEAAR